MLKKFFILFLFFGSASADNCIKYKTIPNINISQPSYTKQVIQPIEPMDIYHGNVVATMVQDFDIIADIIMSGDGYCVVIKGIDAEIGYNDFSVQIDSSHIRGSCSYNAVLNHENKHVAAYLSVIDDLKSDIASSVFNAANSVMPEFAGSKEDIDLVIEKMNMKIQSHPEIILIKQKIKAAEEIRNKRIDQNENNTDLESCL